MKALQHSSHHRIFAIAAAVTLATCALLAVVSLLPGGQPRPALAQGGGTGTITHTLVADFNVCAVPTSTRILTNTAVANTAGGEIRLAALLEDYFDGTAVVTSTWVVTELFSGPPIVGNGLITIVNGGVRSVITVPTPLGRVIEMRARLQQPGGGTGFGDIGFGRQNAPGGPDPVGANRLFITMNANDLYANARDDTVPPTNTQIAGINLTQFHVYRIEWDATEARYYINGVFFPTATVASTFVYTPYVWLYSIAMGDLIDVDWVRVLYYPTMTGQYQSCAMDSAQQSSWTTLTYASALPAGTSATFETRSSSDGVAWGAWAQAGASGSTIPSPNGRYLQYRITLSTTNVNASPEIGSVIVGYELNEPPTANAGGPYAPSEGIPLTLSGTLSTDPNNDPLTYEWDLNYTGSFSATATGVTTTVTFPDGPATRTIALRVRDESGLTGIQSTTVTITNVVPTISAVTNSGPIDEGLSATITVTATDPAGVNDPLLYQFDCDNNGAFEVGPQSGNSTACAFGDNGSFAVNVRVTDDDGGLTNSSTTVAVNNVAPTVNPPSVTPPSSAEGSAMFSSATFSDLAGSLDAPFTCAVNYGDGTGNLAGTVFGATCTGPVHIYTENGAYTVTVSVIDNDSGVGSNSTAHTVTNAAPTISSVSNSGPIVEGLSATITITASDPAGANDPLNYAFDCNNDFVYEVGPQPGSATACAFGDNGSFTVNVRVADDDGGSTNSSTTVTVNNVAPTVSTTGPYTGAEGSPIAFTGNYTDVPSDTHTFLWSFGDGATSTLRTPSHAYADNGVYTAVFTTTDDDGGFNVVSTTVTLSNVAPIMHIGPDRSANEGSLVSFSATVIDPGSADTFTYLWNFGDGITSTLAAPSHAYADNGVYTATLTLFDDDGGGPATNQAAITVDNVAPVIDAGSYTAAGGVVITFSVTITDVPADTHVVAWDLDFNGTYEAIGQTVTRTYVLAGNYQVGVRVTDDDGASTTGAAQVTITRNSPDAYQIYMPRVARNAGSASGSSQLSASTFLAWWTSQIQQFVGRW